MKLRDRLGKHKWDNLPIVNPTQNAYRRFVRTPQAGVPDMLSKYKAGWDEIMNAATKSRIEDM